MNQNIIESYINKLGKEAHLVGKADEEKIKYIESVLNISLPNSYKWFLKEFGLLVIPGFTILGNGLDTIPACVESTLDWRNYGLPSSFVVIEDPDIMPTHTPTYIVIFGW